MTEAIFPDERTTDTDNLATRYFYEFLTELTANRAFTTGRADQIRESLENLLEEVKKRNWPSMMDVLLAIRELDSEDKVSGALNGESIMLFVTDSEIEDYIGEIRDEFYDSDVPGIKQDAYDSGFSDGQEESEREHATEIKRLQAECDENIDKTAECYYAAGERDGIDKAHTEAVTTIMKEELDKARVQGYIAGIKMGLIDAEYVTYHEGFKDGAASNPQVLNHKRRLVYKGT